jgi:hypothetical protein
MNLYEARMRWEKGSGKSVVYEANRRDDTLVVLKNDNEELYTLMRYYPWNGSYRASVDAESAPASEVFKALNYYNFNKRKYMR